MLHGDWGFSFASRIDVDTLILQRLPTTLIVIGAAQVLAILVALPVGVLAGTRPYSIFDQIANTLAFIGFSLPTFFTGLLLILLFSDQARLAAVRLPRRPQLDRLDLVVGADQAVDHAGDGARPVPGRLAGALRALGGARRGAARLRHHRALQGHRRARGDHAGTSCATR